MHVPVTIALKTVALCGLLRGIVVIVGGLVSLLRRRRYERVRLGWSELAVVPEPMLLIAASVRLYQSALHPPPLAAWAGALLGLVGWAMLLWTFGSWPAIHVGHALSKGQTLVTTGAYGCVRHPAYLAAILVWSALGLEYWSLLGAAVAMLYVIPAYVSYARTEEKMMDEAFGATYRSYAASVPGFLPRLRRHARAQ